MWSCNKFKLIIWSVSGTTLITQIVLNSVRYRTSAEVIYKSCCHYK